MQIELIKFSYKYMEYEKELQVRELLTLLPDAKIISDTKQSTIIFCPTIEKKILRELTYYSSFVIDDISYPTRQGVYEQDDTVRISKQHTRYSTHGLHEYKGKFNPQIVHAIINVFNVKKGQIVLDPFDGSGTTILECAHAGISSYGTDINPMACYIANTKVSSLKINIKDAYAILETLKEKLSSPSPLYVVDENERIKYLQNWIPEETLLILETLREEMKTKEKSMADFFLVVASDLIRDYSYQEPSDLRIRRRKSPFPEIPFINAYYSNIHKYLKRIEAIQSVEKCDFFPQNYAVNCDIKTDNPFDKIKFDAAITSPPYATALPYIDTQRISLVWLELCNATEIGKLEASLIGSRELLKSEKNKWAEVIKLNGSDLPDEIFNLIIMMNNSLTEKDGFRKQAVPALTYKYFSEMKEMFVNVKKMMKEDALYGLVVGHNKTTLGGTEYNIDTPKLLAILAQSCRWNIEELFPLQTYKRYGLNSKNAINRETLIILRNNLGGM